MKEIQTRRGHYAWHGNSYKRYICTHCKLGFGDFIKLDQHLLNKHDIKFVGKGAKNEVS